MKAWIPLAVLGAVLTAYARVGIRPLRTAHPEVSSTVQARSYWVEHIQDGPSRLRHKWGASWPLETYDGQSGRLWIARPPSISHAFLVFDHECGRSMIQRLVWRMDGPFRLARVATLFTWDDYLWEKGDDDSRGRTFHDVDGDGREDISSTVRTWLADEDDQGWGHRTVFHAWSGDRFEPRWARLFFGTYGPLLSADEARSRVWSRPGN